MDEKYFKAVINGEDDNCMNITTEYHNLNQKQQAAVIITLLYDFYEEYGTNYTIEVFKSFVNYTEYKDAIHDKN